MHDRWEKYGMYFLSVLLLAALGIVLFNTENSFGGGDHFSHFRLARWGWVYPDMLFNHWGKPVFTLLISPFAQLGMNGARMYNLVLGIITALVTWQLARHFGFRHAWITWILVLFTPVYFILMFAVLTEITFSFFLVLSIFLFFNKKYIWSALVLSFLPLVRTEGIVLFVLFAVAYAMKRKYQAIPFLGAGFFIISFLGQGYYNSFWWLITEMPYSVGANKIYGSGSLTHFIEQNDLILGPVLGLLFILGSLLMLVQWVRADRFRLNDRFYFLWLITGSFIVFFAAHSYVWWKGIGSSLGLTRVIGSVTPLAALTAMVAVDWLFHLVKKERLKLLVPSLLLVVLTYFVVDGVRVHRYGFRLSRPQQLISKTADYLKTEDLDSHKIYYYNVFLSHVMDFDPRDSHRSQHYLPLDEYFLNSVPDSSIIVWDAHFGPNEGRMPLDNLMESKELRVLRVIKPDKPFKVLGGNDYQIVVFQKDLALIPRLKDIRLDFEESGNASDELAYRGSKSFLIEKRLRYKTLADVIYEQLSPALKQTAVQVTLASAFDQSFDPNEMLLVCSMESQDSVIFYETRDLYDQSVTSGQWTRREYSFALPRARTKYDRIKIYVWNRQGNQLFIDEVFIRMLPEGE